jgi:peptidoglycan hydrolase CwlO-like protein
MPTLPNDIFASRKTILEKQGQVAAAVKDVVKEITEVGAKADKTEEDHAWLVTCRELLQSLKKDYALLNGQLDKIGDIIESIDTLEQENQVIITEIDSSLAEKVQLLNPPAEVDEDRKNEAAAASRANIKMFRKSIF